MDINKANELISGAVFRLNKEMEKDNKMDDSWSDFPNLVFVGREAGKWQIFMFASEDVALAWLNGESLGHRSLFEAKVEILCEMKVVPPVPARLVPMDQ